MADLLVVWFCVAAPFAILWVGFKIAERRPHKWEYSADEWAAAEGIHRTYASELARPVEVIDVTFTESTRS